MHVKLPTHIQNGAKLSSARGSVPIHGSHTSTKHRDGSETLNVSPEDMRPSNVCSRYEEDIGPNPALDKGELLTKTETDLSSYVKVLIVHAFDESTVHSNQVFTEHAFYTLFGLGRLCSGNDHDPIS